MRSLYLRIWLTVVAALALFALVSGWVVQRHLEEQREQAERPVAGALAGLGRPAAGLAAAGRCAPAEQAQGLNQWSRQMRVPMALDAPMAAASRPPTAGCAVARPGAG
jgi:hypothetical protein